MPISSDYFAAKLAGVPAVVSSRHLDDAFRYRARWRRINRRIWRMIDAGIAISAAMKQFALEIEEAPADKIDHRALWHGLPLAQRRRHQQPPGSGLRAELKLGGRCAIAGHGLPPGGAERASPMRLEALRRIRTDFPRAHLAIAGDGEKAD